MSDNKISNELAKAYVQISQTEDDGTSSLHSDIEYNSINKKIPKQKNYENEESDIGISQSNSYQSKNSYQKKILI